MKKSLTYGSFLFLALSLVSAVSAIRSVADGVDGVVKNPAGPTNTLPDLTKEHEFDGIEVQKYARFWDKWHLVTVRYRKDNGEQRFVYANDLAFNAMKTGEKKFPDGAMFGKVAFNVAEDSAFPNSLEPRGFTRVQLMRKNDKRYKDSNGWGYALYTYGLGVPYKSVKPTVVACHACHMLVPGRDYVFSQSAFIGGWNSAVDETFYSQFKDTPIGSLSHFSRAVLNESRGQLSSGGQLKMLKMSLFDGSVNESIGPVIGYARKNQQAYLLVDEKTGYFIAAVPTPAGQPSSCAGEVKVARMRQLHSNGNGPVRLKQAVDHAIACADDRVIWEGVHVTDETPETWQPK